MRRLATIIFRETLPSGCPPADAQDILGPLVRYRLLADSVAAQKDFDSFAHQHGGPVPNGVDPCIQYGLSVYDTEDAARKQLTSSSNNQDWQNRGKPRWTHIGKVTLDVGAGKVTRVTSRNHQTWWPSSGFNPVDHCKVLL